MTIEPGRGAKADEQIPGPLTEAELEERRNLGKLYFELLGISPEAAETKLEFTDHYNGDQVVAAAASRFTEFCPPQALHMVKVVLGYEPGEGQENKKRILVESMRASLVERMLAQGVDPTILEPVPDAARPAEG